MRHFEFTVDRAHAKSVNQTLKDLRQMQISAVILAVVLVAGAVFLIMVGRAWSVVLGVVLIAGAVTSLFLAVWMPRKMGSIDELYRKSPLVPAVVSESHPRALTLLALVDIAKSETGGRAYALVTRNIPTMPGLQLRIGDRMPSVALLGDRGRRSGATTWQMVSPMPIAWGTRDKATRVRADAAIDGIEWDFLASRIDESETVRNSPDQRVLLEIGELPEELR
ncbi:DUF3239 domain-containing protein [Rhodococcus sp. NPDC058521]|uniref:DUF3239 domain-containing protein n=1 Tax=Rhodococcus sp. NPDC058521 TaxID=3346536 RepID=UPI003656DA99